MLNMTQGIRIIGLVISLWGINVASFAGNGITSLVHRYSGNDEYVKMEVAGISGGDSLRNQVWDFSNATILDGNMNITVKEVFKDSVYHEIRNRTFYKYSLRNDTLYWHGLENRLTNVNDANGVAVMKYPFVLGDSLAGSYCLTGEYSKSTSYIEKGIMIHVADATGRIIMPHGVIDDVLRVKGCRKFVAMVSDTISIELLHASSDTLPQVEETIYRWYSPQYKYPVAECVDYRITKCDTLMGTSSQAYISESAYYAERSKSDFNSAKFGTRSIGFNEIRLEATDDELTHYVTADARIELDGSRNVMAEYALNSSCRQLEITLCDPQGRVYGYLKHENLASGVYSDNMPLNNTPPGQYLLIIKCDNEVIHRQLIEAK